MIKMDVDALHAFLKSDFPQVGEGFRVEHAAPNALRVRHAVSVADLRPGGTISGPTMFALADLAMYCAVLSMIGPVALAVTTNCSIDFLRKPEAGRDLVADARLLKLGKRLAVGDVLIRSEGTEAVVARASLTYAIPPER